MNGAWSRRLLKAHPARPTMISPKPTPAERGDQAKSDYDKSQRPSVRL
jgi:hypothetical protein